MPRTNEAHRLPRLPLWQKLVLTGAIASGWVLFSTVWLAALMTSGWGLSWSILADLGALVDGVRKTSPGAFWVLLAAHALSLLLLNGPSQWLANRMAMPRGFRTGLRIAGWGTAGLDLALWGLLPVSGFVRMVLAPVLLIETVGLLALVGLQVRELWLFPRWRGGDRPVRVVIVGGGFGGLYTAMSLDRKLGYHDGLEIVLVDKKNYFLFPPLLPSVATGAIETRQVTNPFRCIFEATNVRFMKRSVEGVDLARRIVRTGAGAMQEEISYDWLVMAPGAQTNTLRVPGADKHAFYMRELGDAIAVRNHVIDCFELAAHERDPVVAADLVRTIVVGAGPTGVELASEIQDLIHHVLLRRYPEINPALPEVWLVQSGGQVLPGWSDRMAGSTKSQLDRIGVRVQLDVRAVKLEPAAVVLSDGGRISARTVVWCTGVKPATVMESLGVPVERGGLVRVAPDLRVPGQDRLFVIGDVALCEHEGHPLPALAQVALQQGDQTGANLVRLLKGRPTKPFKYFNYGSLVCVGEHYAVIDIMGLRLSGFPAWFIWRSLYLFKLVGIGNRVRVMLDWSLDLVVERSISQIRASREEQVEDGAGPIEAGESATVPLTFMTAREE